MLPLLTETEVKFLEYMKACYERLEECRQSVEKLPPGTIIQRQVRGKIYYRHSIYEETGRKHISCTASEAKLLSAQIDKRKRLEKERQFLSKLFHKNNTLLQDLLTRAEKALTDYYAQSRTITKQESSSLHPEHLKIKSSTGMKVRSKSELLIIECFKAHHLNFEYERPLNLPGHKTFLPDFTLYEPLTGKTVYWEHFGLMNQSDYRLRAENKLLQYKESNITEGNNLIITYDEKDGGIDMTKIEKLIKDMFFLGAYRKMLCIH